MSQFTARLSAADADKAVARTERTLAEGFRVLSARVVSERHLLFEVLVEAPEGFDKDDTWVLLTSYGISPSEELGSFWQGVQGVGC